MSIFDSITDSARTTGKRFSGGVNKAYDSLAQKLVPFIQAYDETLKNPSAIVSPINNVITSNDIELQRRLDAMGGTAGLGNPIPSNISSILAASDPKNLGKKRPQAVAASTTANSPSVPFLTPDMQSSGPDMSINSFGPSDWFSGMTSGEPGLQAERYRTSMENFPAYSPTAVPTDATVKDSPVQSVGRALLMMSAGGGNQAAAQVLNEENQRQQFDAMQALRRAGFDSAEKARQFETEQQRFNVGNRDNQILMQGDVQNQLQDQALQAAAARAAMESDSRILAAQMRNPGEFEQKTRYIQTLLQNGLIDEKTANDLRISLYNGDMAVLNRLMPGQTSQTDPLAAVREVLKRDPSILNSK